MTRNHTGDVVNDYLHDVEELLDRLPPTQRRELLDDLETHIATERAERNAESDAELLQILHRLGSPDVVAAAAYEETPGLLAAAPAMPGTHGRRWNVTAVVIIAVLVLIVILALFFATRGGNSVSVPIPPPAR
jgi:uncharacterized membrane protein